MARVEDILPKMMRRFDASYEHTKELRNNLAGIGQKVDTHAISIKQLELQLAQLSATANSQQPGTIPSNTVQNPKLLLAVASKPLTLLCRLMRKR